MRRFLDNYWDDQHRAGRFLRPRNIRLTDVSHWLADQRVVPNDNRVLVGVAAAFLVICLLNAAGLLLSQFLKGAHAASVRRALGANRGQIILQHLVEAGVVASVGGALGLVLSAAGLAGVHTLYARGSIGPAGYQQIVHLSPDSVVWALVLAVLCTLAVGLYPAWRVGVLAPAAHLKEG
jgi:putative ABC transport system permease protein